MLSVKWINYIKEYVSVVFPRCTIINGSYVLPTVKITSAGVHPK